MSDSKWNVIDENGATALPDFASIPTEWGFARAATAHRGEIPTIKIGKRLLVPLAAFERMLQGAA